MVKWDKLKVTTTMDNKIVIGKLAEQKSGISGLMFFEEMSEDRTSECVKAVMQHMDEEVEEGKDQVSYTAPGYGKLTWTPEREEDDESGE